MTEDRIPATSSWDSRTMEQLIRRGHSFKDIEKSFEVLSPEKMFVVARGLITILNEEIAPHPDVMPPNEQDVRFVADRLTACLSVIERRFRELQNATTPDG